MNPTDLSTMFILNTFSDFFLIMGIGGLVLAIIAAVIGLVAVVGGSSRLMLAALTAWLIASILSLTFLYRESWILTVYIVAAVPLAVLLGTLVRLTIAVGGSTLLAKRNSTTPDSSRSSVANDADTSSDNPQD